jgi:outer membrane protein OmpA-like peptidoglycan-associated protein
MANTYEDELELELELQQLDELSPRAPRPAQPPPLSTIAGRPFQVLGRFDYDRYSLTTDHMAIIDGIACHVVASWRTPWPIRTIRLVGHTDITGSAAYDYQLGRKRAEEVQKGLSNAIERLRPGFSKNIRFLLQSFGKDAPIAYNSTPLCRALNRRVEVFPGAIVSGVRRPVPPAPPRREKGGPTEPPARAEKRHPDFRQLRYSECLRDCASRHKTRGVGTPFEWCRTACVRELLGWGEPRVWGG